MEEAPALAGVVEALNPAVAFIAMAETPTCARNFLRVSDFGLLLDMIKSPFA
jgi:hypothetical protein